MCIYGCTVHSKLINFIRYSQRRSGQLTKLRKFGEFKSFLTSILHVHIVTCICSFLDSGDIKVYMSFDFIDTVAGVLPL